MKKKVSRFSVERVLSKKEVVEMVPYSRSHIDRLEKQGEFPKRIKLGKRRVGWRLSQIEHWIQERENESNFGKA